MKHWVFDLDGTLVDSFSRYFKALNEIFQEHGYQFTDAHREPALTSHLPAFFRQELGARAVAPALTKLLEVSNNDAPLIQPFSGILETIDLLKSRGCQIAVWTSREFTSTDIILKETGISRKIETFVSGTCVTNRKPDTEGLVRIIEQHEWNPEEVTMVGDHFHDVQAANQVGVRSVRASWHSYWKIGTCPDADHQFHSVEDFHRWVKSSSNGRDG
ncbi:HAD family hydrolase [bacterium]|jgi:phosphoglycolate phosphatase-like HAD superfamily hydrolase|nr:HAD family hydrolase [bacterium]